MDKSQILNNENANDGKTIYLYYDEMIGCYVAYGLSAFFVTYVTDPIASYSEVMQMPLVILNRRQILDLRQSLRKVEHEMHNYYRFETKAVVSDSGYSNWSEKVKMKATRYAR